MKKNLVLALSLCAVVMFTSCKSRESAYRQAYEQAMTAEKNQTEQQTVVSQPVTTEPVVSQEVVTSAPQTEVVEDHSDVREIQGELSVIAGNPLKLYSVVVGSYVTQANAEGQYSRLRNEGYDSRIVKTNETINGQTGWFRVVASSFVDKASAVQSRNTLRQTYPGAWLLYRK